MGGAERLRGLEGELRANTFPYRNLRREIGLLYESIQ